MRTNIISPHDLEYEAQLILSLHDYDVILAAATKILKDQGQPVLRVKVTDGYNQFTVEDEEGYHRLQHRDAADLYTLPLKRKA